MGTAGSTVQKRVKVPKRDLLAVRVTPGARKNRIEREADQQSPTQYRIWVTAPAGKGAANAAALALLARELGCPKSALSVFRGHRSRQKIFARLRR